MQGKRSNFSWKFLACECNSLCFLSLWKNNSETVSNCYWLISTSTLCGYGKDFNTPYVLLSLIKKWKKTLEGKKFMGAVLLDLSKAFDVINDELLIAKGFLKMPRNWFLVIS